MRLILPIILLIVGVGAGVGAGLMLGGSAEQAASDAPEQAAADDAYETAEGDAYETADEETPETPPRVEAANENTEYVRLNNQFVVPIVREGAVRSLVVMGITIETQAGQSSIVFTQEPRLRDTFLRVMFAHANTGGFDGIFTEAAAMAPLREGLLEAAESTLGSAIVYDVLITDLTRQDA